jgi:hypothetical protein
MTGPCENSTLPSHSIAAEKQLGLATAASSVVCSANCGCRLALLSATVRSATVAFSHPNGQTGYDDTNKRIFANICGERYKTKGSDVTDIFFYFLAWRQLVINRVDRSDPYTH